MTTGTLTMHSFVACWVCWLGCCSCWLDDSFRPLRFRLPQGRPSTLVLWTARRSYTRRLGSEGSTRGLYSRSCEVTFEPSTCGGFATGRSCLDLWISLGIVHATALIGLARCVLLLGHFTSGQHGHAWEWGDLPSFWSAGPQGWKSWQWQ